jgi:hypothetical protein
METVKISELENRLGELKALKNEFLGERIKNEVPKILKFYEKTRNLGQKDFEFKSNEILSAHRLITDFLTHYESIIDEDIKNITEELNNLKQ